MSPAYSQTIKLKRGGRGATRHTEGGDDEGGPATEQTENTCEEKSWRRQRKRVGEEELKGVRTFTREYWESVFFTWGQRGEGGVWNQLAR